MDTHKPLVLFVGIDAGNDASSYTFQVRRGFEECGWRTESFHYRWAHLHRLPGAYHAISKLLIERVRRLKPDLLFVIKGEAFLPGTIDAIRRLGVRTANWTLDEPFGTCSRFNRIPNIPEYDTYFIFDDAYVPQLLAAGAREAHFMPVGTEPDIYAEQVPWEQRQYSCDASFVGSHHPNREAMLAQLQGVDLKIWGYRWNNIPSTSPLRSAVQPTFPRANKEVAAIPEIVRLWNLSKCNINIHHPQVQGNGPNLRIFELMATKSFQICDAIKRIGTLFVPDKDFVLYNDVNELRRHIAYYTEHPAERRAMVEHAHASLVKRHRTLHRVQAMLDIIGVENRPAPPLVQRVR